jgi:hypothetical protein
MNVKKPLNGYVVTENDKPEFTAEKYGRMLGVDFAAIYADKDVMYRFEKLLKHKTKSITALAHKKREMPRELGIIERHILLAELYKREITYRERRKSISERFGDALPSISKLHVESHHSFMRMEGNSE